MENITLAAKKACSSRRDKTEVAAFLENKEIKLENLRQSLISHTYKSSRYRMFEVNEYGKTRNVADLPLYPDRICHWAIALGIEDKLNAKLIDQSYASRPFFGTHYAITKIKSYLDKDPKIKYCLKIDISKFFPSCNKNILKAKLRTVLKDRDLLIELDKIIDEYPYPGIPIGNRTSPMFANLYLSEMDHMLREKYHVHYMARYMDDIVILGYSKEWLHKIRDVMAASLSEIGLTMKKNWQIFPIDDRGIDFVGYVVFRTHILLRKSTKKRLIKASDRLLKKLESGQELSEHDLGTIASYKGILQWCNGYNLYRSTFYRVEQKAAELKRERIGQLHSATSQLCKMRCTHE